MPRIALFLSHSEARCTSGPGCPRAASLTRGSTATQRGYVGTMARIIVIDDNDAARGTMRRVLEKAGHDDPEASDGDARSRANSAKAVRASGAAASG